MDFMDLDGIYGLCAFNSACLTQWCSLFVLTFIITYLPDDDQVGKMMISDCIVITTPVCDGIVVFLLLPANAT